jgi:hypothetical protein
LIRNITRIFAIFAVGSIFIHCEQKTSSDLRHLNTDSNSGLATIDGTVDGTTTLTDKGKPVLPDQSSCTISPTTGLCIVETTLLQDKVSQLATHISTQFTVLENQHGIFLTYEPYSYATNHTTEEQIGTSFWKLMRSKDGGKTFEVVYGKKDILTEPPPITSDADGNIYLVQTDDFRWEKIPFTNIDLAPKDLTFYRYDAAKNFQDPHTKKIAGAASGKMVFSFDADRSQLLYFAQNASTITSIKNFFILDLDGNVKSSTALFRTGGNFTALMYPRLGLGPDALYFSWFTEHENQGAPNVYRGVHFILSRDFGGTWENLQGNKIDSLPFISDENGPSTLVSLPENFGNNNVMGGMIYKENKLHFVYVVGKVAADTSSLGTHYVRFDLQKKIRDTDRYPWEVGKLHPGGQGGFVTNHKDPISPLYAVTAGYVNDKQGMFIVVLISTDNGNTWREYAVSDNEEADMLIGGVNVFPSITPSGYLIGTYTRCYPRTNPAGDGTPSGWCNDLVGGQFILDSKIYFFRIRAKGPGEN